MLLLQYSNQNGGHNSLHGGSLSYTLMCDFNGFFSVNFDDLS